MSWIILTKEQKPLYEKRKLTWFYGINPIELENGDFALPDRVIKDIEKFDPKSKEIELPNHSISAIDVELKKLPKQDNVVFKVVIYHIIPKPKVILKSLRAKLAPKPKPVPKPILEVEPEPVKVAPEAKPKRGFFGRIIAGIKRLFK